MKLLIDVGNTRLKCALWDGTALHDLGSATHAAAMQAALMDADPAHNVDFAALFMHVADVSAIFVASVAASALEQRLTQSLAQRFPIAPRFVASAASACGVRNAYPQPERLGVDRFLGLIALHALEHGPCVLASCGTALTLDALAADGTHLGGMISASPALSIDALTGSTARLQAPKSAHVVEFADNTDDAIESGAWLAAVALIERFVARAAPPLGGTPALVLSGGGAARLSALVALPHRVDASLVLRGLAIYADSVTSIP
jgi:type III pantothenate kinase